MKRLTLLLVLLTSSLAFSQQVEVEIVQTKLSRLYLAAGTEAGIEPGATIVIDCEGREISAGTVEYSGPGISFSAPIPSLDSIIIDTGCVARVAIAAIDSSAAIVVGTDLPLDQYDPEHEPIFIRDADTIVMNLVDSARIIGSSLTLFLGTGIRFSDGSPLTSEELARFFVNLKETGRSYLTRYFFSKLLPIDSGGMTVIDGFTLRMEFFHPFPRVGFFLSHPDFAVYNTSGRGTGPLTESPDSEGAHGYRTFAPNTYYRGDPPLFSTVTVRHYDQEYRMKFAFENGDLDGMICFGFESDLAGVYEAKSLYSDVVAMISGIGRELFSGGLFPTSLYYSFNPSPGHLYFQYGDIRAINRWLPPVSGDPAGSRYYPFNILKGKQLFGSVNRDIDSVLIMYDYPLLYNTADYLADIAAREGMTASKRRYVPGSAYDIRVVLLPASDSIMPFGLAAAVLELNDQNSILAPGDRMDRPGWNDFGRGSQMYDLKNRQTFFSRAEETVFQEGAFFPLFRPYVFAVPASNISGFRFDHYGYPVIDGLRKLRRGTGSKSDVGNR